MKTKETFQQKTLNESTDSLRRNLYSEIDSKYMNKIDLCQIHDREFECFCDDCKT